MEGVSDQIKADGSDKIRRCLDWQGLTTGDQHPPISSDSLDVGIKNPCLDRRCGRK